MPSKGSTPKILMGLRFFVSLEPCSYEGKTPSCAKRLSELPVSKVWYGVLDPNPLVNGKGIEILKSAGISVEKFTSFEDEAKELIEVFSWNQTQKKTFFAAKVGVTMDGHLAHKSGESQWITGEEARSFTHNLRGQFDGILVGAGTIEKDNPSLNSRSDKFLKKENFVFVMDPEGRFEKGSLKINEVRSTEKVFFIVKKGNKENQIECPTLEDGNFDLDFLSGKLFEMGVYSVLVEGGAFTISQFASQKILKRIYCFVAPILLGGDTGINWTSGLSFPSLKESLRLKNVKHIPLGSDVLITGLV